MNDRDERRLDTADMAAAGAGATAERIDTRGDARSRTSELRPGMPVSERTDESAHAPLFPLEEAAALRKRWEEVQSGFVDEPREAVEHADQLVAEVMRRLAETFASERQQLERQWTEGDDVSTEDLRLALRKYRSFFDRLLAL